MKPCINREALIAEFPARYGTPPTETDLSLIEQLYSYAYTAYVEGARDAASGAECSPPSAWTRDEIIAAFIEVYNEAPRDVAVNAVMLAQKYEFEAYRAGYREAQEVKVSG